MNILITGAKNAKVLKLTKAFPNDFLLFGDYGEVPSVATTQYRFESLGEKNEESIAHILLAFCLSQAIDIIIPTLKFEIPQLVKAKQLLEEYGIQLLLPDENKLPEFLTDEPILNPIILVVNNSAIIYTSKAGNTSVPKIDQNGIFEISEDGQNVKLFLV